MNGVKRGGGALRIPLRDCGFRKDCMARSLITLSGNFLRNAASSVIPPHCGRTGGAFAHARTLRILRGVMGVVPPQQNISAPRQDDCDPNCSGRARDWRRDHIRLLHEARANRRDAVRLQRKAYRATRGERLVADRLFR